MKAFADRAAAGRQLAPHLQQYRGRTDVLVLGLPRGGVPVAREVARFLDAPLDAMIVRKLGAPHQPEFAVGAIASGGITVTNEGALDWSADSPAMVQIVAEERKELQRREVAYRAGRPALAIENRIVILVDDGAATGTSMLAAVRAARKMQASKIIVALPVAAAEACYLLRDEADEVVCLGTPPSFAAVGSWYVDFAQTTDQEVIDLLARSAHENAGQLQ
jgi:predicted phosphoribosyltransferase